MIQSVVNFSCMHLPMNHDAIGFKFFERNVHVF